MTQNTILHIDSSIRTSDSLSRQASQLVANKLDNDNSHSLIKYRDVSLGLPLIDRNWINANLTAVEQRDEQANKVLQFSDTLIDELKQARLLVIGVPTYNFNIPAYLKAWIDLIARAKVTFQYTDNGPQGLLKDKKAYLVIASGGVPIGSEADFVSSYLSRIMTFIGITDVTIIDATKIDFKKNSGQQIEALM